MGDPTDLNQSEDFLLQQDEPWILSPGSQTYHHLALFDKSLSPHLLSRFQAFGVEAGKHALQMISVNFAEVIPNEIFLLSINPCVHHRGYVGGLYCRVIAGSLQEAGIAAEVDAGAPLTSYR